MKLQIEIASMPRVKIHVTANEKGLQSAKLCENSAFILEFEGTELFFKQTVAWLKSYANKESAPLPPLDLGAHPSFRQKVLNALIQVPVGQVVNYQLLAKISGSERAARAVGSVCAANPLPLFIPCHRVILKSGEIGEFLFGTELKKNLLFFERNPGV